MIVQFNVNAPHQTDLTHHLFPTQWASKSVEHVQAPEGTPRPPVGRWLVGALTERENNSHHHFSFFYFCECWVSPLLKFSSLTCQSVLSEQVALSKRNSLTFGVLSFFFFFLLLLIWLIAWSCLLDELLKVDSVSFVPILQPFFIFDFDFCTW